VYCSVPVPATIEAVAGPIEIPVSAGLVTVSMLDPVVPAEVALIFAVPMETPSTTPGLVILAVNGLLLDQVTVEVQSELVLFAKLQVALYWFIDKPATTEAVAGVTVMLFRGAAVTVRELVPFTVPAMALIVVAPTAIPVARPLFEMVAIEALLLVHVMVDGHAAVVPFANVQVAVYCWVPDPATIDAVAGEMTIELSALVVTVITLVAEVEPERAVIVEVPAVTPVTRPAALTVATVVVLLDQVTVDVQLELVLLA
jgi:hypothetical protein